jgi:hypothetical protein
MDPAQWIASFRRAHELAKRGSLSEGEKKKYLSSCDELARSLMTSQGQTAPDEIAPRRALRVAQLFQVEVNNTTRTTTRELSCLGFTATVAGAFSVGDQIDYALTLSRGTDPITGSAEVIAAPKQGGGAARLTVQFGKLDEGRLSRIELAVFDAALSRIQ